MSKGTNRKSRRPIAGMRPGSNPSLGKVDWDHAEYESVIRQREIDRDRRRAAYQDGNP